MEKIVIKPYHPGGPNRNAYLIDQTHAIHSNGTYVSLIEIRPADPPGTYVPAAPFNSIVVATGGRTVAALQRIAGKLKTMSAYALLTECYDVQEGTFHINKRKG